MLNRRDLLKQAALSTLARHAWLSNSSTRTRAINALQLEPFVDPLPLLQSLTPEGLAFRITMREIRVKMHRDLAPTLLWSYGPGAVGPLLEARSHKELAVEWRNELPPRHFLPHRLHPTRLRP